MGFSGSFLDTLLGFLACGTVVGTTAVLVLYWHSLLGPVRDACKAGHSHLNRGRLLWLVSLSLCAWVLAFLIYIRNVIALWQIKTDSLRNGFVKGVVYTCLDVYSVLVIIAGALGVLTTFCFIYWYRQELNDIVMIIKFKPSDTRPSGQRPDIEAPRAHASPSPLSPSPASFLSPSPRSPPAPPGSIELRDLRESAVRATFSDDIVSPQNETDKQPFFPLRIPDEAFRPNQQKRHPVERLFRKGAGCYMQIAKDEAYKQAARSSVRDIAVNTPLPSSPDSKGEAPSLVSDCESEDFDEYYDGSPRRSRPSSPNAALVDRGALSHCSSCSESHTSNIPQTRTASVREPLTPTSPVRELEGLANPWIESTATSSPHLDHASDQHMDDAEAHASHLASLLAGMDTREDEGESMSVVSTISDFDGSFPDTLERYGREITGPPVPDPSEASSRRTPTPEPQESRNEAEPWQHRFERLKLDGIDPEATIAEVDNELQQKAHREDQDHELRQQSLARQQQALRDNDRGQAIITALAVQRGIPTPPYTATVTPSASSSSGRGSNIPNPPPLSPWARQPPKPQRVSVDSSQPPRSIRLSADPSPPLRPQRVFADPRLVNLTHDDRPNFSRISSPRLRVPTVQSEEADDRENWWMATADHPSGNEYW